MNAVHGKSLVGALCIAVLLLGSRNSMATSPTSSEYFLTYTDTITGSYVPVDWVAYKDMSAMDDLAADVAEKGHSEVKNLMLIFFALPMIRDSTQIIDRTLLELPLDAPARPNLLALRMQSELLLKRLAANPQEFDSIDIAQKNAAHMVEQGAKLHRDGVKDLSSMLAVARTITEQGPGPEMVQFARHWGEILQALASPPDSKFSSAAGIMMFKSMADLHLHELARAKYIAALKLEADDRKRQQEEDEEDRDDDTIDHCLADNLRWIRDESYSAGGYYECRYPVRF